MAKSRKRDGPLREILIILLIFTFCFLVVIRGAEPLYDVVRDCIIAILIVYVGWRGLSRRNTSATNGNKTRENDNDE